MYHTLNQGDLNFTLENSGETIGRISMILAVTLKVLSFIKIATVNDGLTLVLTLISVVYMIFKASNEIKTFLRNKRKL